MRAVSPYKSSSPQTTFRETVGLALSCCRWRGIHGLGLRRTAPRLRPRPSRCTPGGIAAASLRKALVWTVFSAEAAVPMCLGRISTIVLPVGSSSLFLQCRSIPPGDHDHPFRYRSAAVNRSGRSGNNRLLREKGFRSLPEHLPVDEHNPERDCQEHSREMHFVNCSMLEPSATASYMQWNSIAARIRRLCL